MADPEKDTGPIDVILAIAFVLILSFILWEVMTLFHIGEHP